MNGRRWKQIRETGERLNSASAGRHNMMLGSVCSVTHTHTHTHSRTHSRTYTHSLTVTRTHTHTHSHIHTHTHTHTHTHILQFVAFINLNICGLETCWVTRRRVQSCCLQGAALPAGQVTRPAATLFDGDSRNTALN